MDPLSSTRLFESAQRTWRDDLAWSALPSAPVVPARRRLARTRHWVAVALRVLADVIDGCRPLRRVLVPARS